MIELALYQPDIAANTGTLARLSACLGLRLTIIEPAGFAWDDSKLRRAGMDYLDIAAIERVPSWEHFCVKNSNRRILLLTTKAATPYTRFAFEKNDIVMLGRESSGVPQAVHDSVSARLTIPMKANARSLNVALAASMVVGEALRQTNSLLLGTET